MRQVSIVYREYSWRRWPTPAGGTACQPSGLQRQQPEPREVWTRYGCPTTRARGRRWLLVGCWPGASGEPSGTCQGRPGGPGRELWGSHPCVRRAHLNSVGGVPHCSGPNQGERTQRDAARIQETRRRHVRVTGATSSLSIPRGIVEGVPRAPNNLGFRAFSSIAARPSAVNGSPSV